MRSWASAPDNDYAHYALGRCLLELGRPDEARAHLRLARALRPESDLYREALSALESAGVAWPRGVRRGGAPR